jgi:prophage regulatory protein
MSVILRLPSVKNKTGLSRSSIYLRMRRGDFPKTISLGDRAVGWLEDEIESWIAHRIEQSRPAAENSTARNAVSTVVSQIKKPRTK